MEPAPARTRETFSRHERILRSREFRQIQRGGSRRVGEHIVAIGRPRRQPWTRIGLTVSRKVGNAVVRNRVKRRLREIFRRNKTRFPLGFDVVLIARRSAATAPFQALQAEVLHLVEKLPKRSSRGNRRGGSGR